ncbi:Phosphatidate cytidylyltransferase, mitochondrial [Orchesella cincta]|uniref:Phosphatidate cytidylyltransferase, mitochondrial n=1 Tax=Orchesella cincta TaxID=48709 RepID=A0A1D2MPI9_ORCCI|nr:Phosphatidate cytidylyltransferase, mitochondrial [Orchesella cincta]
MTLPVPLQISLAKQHFRDPRFFDIEDIMGELSYLPDLRLHIRTSISEIVRASSIQQTLQGVLTAGVFKSIRYAADKMKKRVEARAHTPLQALPPATESEDKQTPIQGLSTASNNKHNTGDSSKAEKGKDMQPPK